MPIDVKICGLSTPETVAAAVEGGAKYVGFVFYPPSERDVTIEQAGKLAAAVPGHVTKVGLAVNPDDHLLEEITAGGFIDMLQLHGGEVPERVAEIKKHFGLPVIKSIAISVPEDVEVAKSYEEAADILLFDALKPEHSDKPGGNALVFDWNLIRDIPWKKPWMLAGGLTAGNLKTAIIVSRAAMVDVSSGVEAEHGVKSPEKIREFLEVAAKLYP